ncbi:cadmium transporter [Spirochaetia bacterium]|nr:cadmium transporter [Spirochaetia bacterium]
MQTVIKKETVGTQHACCSCCSQQGPASVETGKDDTGGRSALKGEIIRLAIGACIFAAALLLSIPQPGSLVLFIAAYLLIGAPVLLQAARNIRRGTIFDENFLMVIATFGAFAIEQYPEAVAVMLFYQIGEMFHALAVNKSRRSIAALMDIRPDFAMLRTPSETKRVSPEEVPVGSLIEVRPGEKIPIDGKVVHGVSSLDTASLTGEALPKDVGVGSEVLSGCINKSGLLLIETSKPFGESTVSRILALVQNAGENKAPVEHFITKFSRYYTPAVVFAAIALAFLPPLIVPSEEFATWIYRALVFLVVSCPCALVISIPLTFFGGLGSASRQGILIKGSNYLDALTKVDMIVFDKTGTLTRGIFMVKEIDAQALFTKDDVLRYAAAAEGISNHPIALSIKAAYQARGDAAGTLAPINAVEIAGLGMCCEIDGKQVLAGNRKLMEQETIAYQRREALGTVVYIAVDGVFAGSIMIADDLKPDAAKAIPALKALGVRKIVMLTGDSKAAGQAAADELGLDEVYTELLPQDKVALIETLDTQKECGSSLVFVGDGINDAPALARSNVGIAMGGIGSDAAIEAADVALMTDEPSALVTAITVARKTRRIVIQNIVFALAVKAAILFLAAFGLAAIWEAVFGDVGVALIAILNALRAMRYRA